MNEIDALVNDLAAAGLTVRAVEGKLRLAPPGAVTAALLARVVARRLQLLAHLAGKGAGAVDHGLQHNGHRQRDAAVADAVDGGHLHRDADGTVVVDHDPEQRHVPAYVHVTSSDGLPSVLAAVRQDTAVGLDCETVGVPPRSALDPYTARVRLVQLATRTETFILDVFAIPHAALAPLWEALAGTTLIVHNALFDVVLLWRMGYRPGTVVDLLVMSRLLTAGTHDGNSLADLAQRYLDVTLDKSYQDSDWSGELTAGQLAYAALDARMTRDLAGPVRRAITDAGMREVARIENRATPAFVWMAVSGVGFSEAGWRAVAAEARRKAAALAAEMNAIAGPRPATIRGVKTPFRGEAWNWNSGPQVKHAFALRGINLPDTKGTTLARHDDPLADRLREYKNVNETVKKEGTYLYGEGKNSRVLDGRLHGGWNQLRAETGRSSCFDPPLQGVPAMLGSEGGKYRDCFVAPPGRELVTADYSQLQLRVAALMTGDERLLRAFAEDADLHRRTAAAVFNKPEVEVTDAERKVGKVCNFALLYGQKPEGFRDSALKKFGVRLTLDQAARYRAAWFDAYPGIRAWHAETERVMRLRRGGGSAVPTSRARGRAGGSCSTAPPTSTSACRPPLWAPRPTAPSWRWRSCGSGGTSARGRSPSCSCTTASSSNATRARAMPLWRGSSGPCTTRWRPCWSRCRAWWTAR
jgi:DNA polymerase-1